MTEGSLPLSEISPKIMTGLKFSWKGDDFHQNKLRAKK